MGKRIFALFIVVAIVISFASPVVFAENFDVEHNISDSVDTGLPVMNITLNETNLEEINSGSKDIKYNSNTIELTDPNNEENNFIDEDVQIKGRGNFSWVLPKRSYQFKLSKGRNVLEMGKAKTWLLIANYADCSLMRNKLTYDLAYEIGLEYTQNSTWIDLYIDGEYQGNYLLCEKVQINDTRVNLANSSGIIVEMDNNYYAAEKNYFKSDLSESYFVLKDSVADDENEENSQAVKDFESFQNYLNNFEQLLYADNKDWNNISAMIDVESFIKYYFIQEFTENADGARSSVFMYKDGKDDVLHMGPVWDFDLALANCDKDNWGGNPNYDYIMNIKKYMDFSADWYTQLFKIPEFRRLAIQIYNNEIKNVLNSVNDKIAQYETILEKSADLNFQKWDTLGKENAFNSGIDRGHKIKDTYAEEVAYLSDWVEKRINYLDERYSENSSIINVNYSSHVEDIGWESESATNGETSGTTGQNKRVEAIKINTDTFNKDISSVSYRTHVQDIGWQNWVSDGEIAGTTGKGLRVEAIELKLDNSSKYSIKYRVHVQDIGWMDWVSDGQLAGTTGRCLKIEAIEIQIVPKNENSTNQEEPKKEDNPKVENALIKYKGHIENIGDTDYVSSGEILGTSGRNLRLEGFKIKLGDSLPSDITLSINVHIQDIGWMYDLTNKDYIGTQGRALRIEAFNLKLKGKGAEKYRIKYRAHVQNIGWQDWKTDGKIAGTTGKSLAIEAIQLIIEEK